MLAICSLTQYIVQQTVQFFRQLNDILYAHQYGFRRGYSTRQANITLIDKITKSVNSDDFVISVFIDLKNAFDCVPTNILPAK